MGLCGKLLCYVCSGEFSGEETCASFAPQLRFACLRICSTVQASSIPYADVHDARNCNASWLCCNYYIKLKNINIIISLNLKFLPIIRALIFLNI